jgi:predicted N-formylglutamate amidohydrolase
MIQPYRVVGESAAEGPLVVTCEHASNAVPPPLTTTERDRKWLAQHWGWDLGAAVVAERLVQTSGSIGVLCGFSRLVCDVNRVVGHPTWIRQEIDGEPLSFNAGLTPEETERRRRELFDPYHRAIDRVLGERRARPGFQYLLSVHSFTPVLDRQHRTMELGVLFDIHEGPARRFHDALAAQGFKAALNEPYSGLDDVIASAAGHGQRHDVTYLELEIRQDLLDSQAAATGVADRVWAALQELLV